MFLDACISACLALMMLTTSAKNDVIPSKGEGTTTHLLEQKEREKVLKIELRGM